MRVALLIIVVLLLVVMAAGLERDRDRAGLTAGYISIQTLDPQMMQASFDVRLAYALFEGLATYEPRRFSLRPGVARSWTISDDGLIYTFELRPDAKWSDGRAVTTRDFLLAWRQGLMPDTAPPYAEFLTGIRGARAYQQWCIDSLKAVRAIEDEDERFAQAAHRLAEAERRFERMVGVRAPGERTLVVELERPTAYFLNLAASWPLFPLPAHVVGPASRLHRSSSMLRRDPQWTKSGRLVSNGPYRLAAWRFKGEVLLEANGQWHAAGSVVERSIRFVHFNDELAMFYAYESGALDVQFGATPLAFMPELLKRKAAGRRNDVHELAAFGTYYYAFNCRPKLPDGRTNPFADVRVRRAFAMTIDKRALVEKVTRLNQPVTSVFIPPGSNRLTSCIDSAKAAQIVTVGFESRHNMRRFRYRRSVERI
jgi:oligopeptide transport system substrate-binding protein